jgi:hypothetical protein
VLVTRVLLVRLTTTLLVACSDPGLIAAHAALQCLVRFGIAGYPVDDILWLELADVRCNRRDDVAMKLLGFAEVLALQAEFILLGHVLASKSTNLVHDVKKDSFGRAVAWSRVLGLVTHIAPSDVHSAISRKCDAVGKLLTPACSAY